MRFSKSIVILPALAIAVAGCAKKPEAIAASYVSEVPYLSWDCEQLGEESIRLSQALAQTSEQQRNARSNDQMGVLFLGLPVSSMSGGNVSDQVARVKGETEAVRRASIRKKCSTTVGGTPRSPGRS